MMIELAYTHLMQRGFSREDAESALCRYKLTPTHMICGFETESARVFEEVPLETMPTEVTAPLSLEDVRGP